MTLLRVALLILIPVQVSSFLASAARVRPAVAARAVSDENVISSVQVQEPVQGRSLLKAVPLGVGCASPDCVVTNADLEGVVDTTDEWIRTRTGISQRKVLGDYDEQSQSLASLATKAAKNALEAAKCDAADLDLVILCTSSPDDLFGDASTVARNLGATNAVAFDLTAACSGFLFGTVTASQFLHNGAFRRALVVGADALSRWVDWDDRNTCILFGDGAGAMILGATETETQGGVLGFAMHSDGGGHDQLNLVFKGEPRDLDTPECTRVAKGSYKPIHMNGREVYRFAVSRVPQVLEEAMRNAGITVDNVDWLLLHQANIRIMEAVADRLGIPKEKIIANLSDYGNTSAASIPLALAEAVQAGKVKSGDVIACAGFGAGLSWGAAIFQWGGDVEMQGLKKPMAREFGPPPQD